ncbi:hypothetical protein HYV57_05110 [Candidatus Peregrinibacteria bacterium]|nr:hypothetical protein [Candidatus Peregrinibacteria bacterium]
MENIIPEENSTKKKGTTPEEGLIPEHIIAERISTPQNSERIKFGIVNALKKSPVIGKIVAKLRKITGDENITVSSICTPITSVMCAFFDEKLDSRQQGKNTKDTEEPTKGQNDEETLKERLEKELLAHLETALTLLNEACFTNTTTQPSNEKDGENSLKIAKAEIEAAVGENTQWAQALYKVIVEKIIQSKIATAAIRADINDENATPITPNTCDGKTGKSDGYIKIIIPPTSSALDSLSKTREIPFIKPSANETPTSLFKKIIDQLRNDFHQVFVAFQNPHLL